MKVIGQAPMVKVVCRRCLQQVEVVLSGEYHKSETCPECTQRDQVIVYRRKKQLLEQLETLV